MVKFPVLQTNEFILYLEQTEQHVFIHCDVLVKWTRKVKENLKKAFKLLSTEYGKELYALHTPGDKKHHKFLRMFDFSYLTSFVGTDGNNYDIYVWR